MNRRTLLVLIWLLLSHCQSSIDASLAFNVAGLYQLVEYNTSTQSDVNPTGTISITQLDNQHVNLVAKGISGKVKINYAYKNVLIVRAGQLVSGQDSYTLSYKGHPIGTAGNDAVVRYVTLTPSSTVTLKAEEF